MEEEFRAILLASSGVQALAGSRVDFGANAQGAAMPRVVLFTISGFSGHSLQAPSGPLQGRVQCDCYGATYRAAKQLSRAVIAALDGFSGGGFQGVFFAATRDTREGGTNEADRPFRTSVDFTTVFTPN
jgi:hypothetical protein